MSSLNDIDENMRGIITSIEKFVGKNNVSLNPSALSWSPPLQNPEDEYIPEPMTNVTNLQTVLPSGATIQKRKNKK
jgi:hypothetical protein